MITSLASRFLLASSFAALTCGLLLAPLPAAAGGTVSKGHGIKCGWVLVSSVNGANTYSFVCRAKGA